MIFSSDSFYTFDGPSTMSRYRSIGVVFLLLSIFTAATSTADPPDGRCLFVASPEVRNYPEDRGHQ